VSITIKLDLNNEGDNQFLMDLAGAEGLSIGEVQYVVVAQVLEGPQKTVISLARLEKKREKVGVVLEDTQKISETEHRAKVRLK
jgi:hypothetical protein